MRGGRSGGGMRSGGSYGRSSMGRSGGYTRSGGSSAGRAGARPSTPKPAPRPSAPRSGGSSTGSSFGRGVAQGVGFGMGQQMGRNMMGGGRRHRRSSFRGPRVVHHHHGSGGNSSGGGCFTFLLIAVIIFAIIMIAGLFNFETGSNANLQNVAVSTIERTPLPSNSANVTGELFTDNLGWINNNTQMNTGLLNFHRLTGVRPHVYITNNINGNFEMPTSAQLEQYAAELYDELFNDEAHLLLIFFENEDGQYTMHGLPGNQARSVMDNEALGILMDFIQRYYYNENLSEEQFFSNAFNSAAERIMHVPHNPWPAVIIVVVIALALIILTIILKNWWKKKKAQTNLEAEQTERILNTPLEGFGNTNSPADDLAKKYDEGDNK